MRTPRGGLPVVLLVLAAAGACGGGSGSDDPASELAGQVERAIGAGSADVSERLGELGAEVGAAELEALEGEDLRCPAVAEPQAGDRATCRFEVRAVEVAVDVEFRDEGLAVVGVEVAP